MKTQRKIDDLIREINAEPCYRTATLRKHEDGDGRYEISFSSEAPYDRWFGTEVLGHRADEIDLDWMESGNAPLLLDHDRTKQIGIVEKAWIQDGRGKAMVRFGKSPLAREVLDDVEDGIRKNISVGYEVKAMQLVEENDDKPDVYRVTRWRPFENSVVSIPADTTVGVGRSQTKTQTKDSTEMDPKIEVKTDPAAEKALAEQKKREARENEQRLVDDTRKAEQARTAELLALGRQHNLGEDAEKYIRDGKSADEFRTFICDHVASAAAANQARVADPNSLSKTERNDLKKWSLLRAIKKTIEGKLDGIEGEMHTEGVKEARNNGLSLQGNLVVPPMAMFSRDFTVGTEGTDVVQTNVGSLIDNLTDRLVLREAGAVFLTGLMGDLQFPRRTNGGTVAWEGETDAGAESTLTTDNVSVSPNRFGLFYDISKQALIQSSPDVEAFHRRDIATVMALAVDNAGLNGTGSGNQPTGVSQTAGIGTVEAGDPDGGEPTWDDIVNLESEVANDNADVGTLAYITNTRIRGKLKRTQIFSGTNGAPVWERSSATPLNDNRCLISNLVPSNGTKGAGSSLSSIFYGNWADLILAMWGGLDILADPYTQATSNLLRLVVNAYADVGVRHAESFSLLDDAITT